MLDNDFSGRTSVEFEVAAESDVYVLLMKDKADEDNDVFEIVIGKILQYFPTLK